MKRFGVPVLSTAILALALATHVGWASRGFAPLVPITDPADAAALKHTSGEDSDTVYNLVVRRTCIACHNDAMRTGNLSLQTFDITSIAPETAEKIIRKLQAGMMPPAGVPRPGGDTLIGLRHALESRMEAMAAANPNPGSRTFQRLNRSEYASSVRDLLGLKIDAGDWLPLDTKSANFDNIADVQMPSATLLQSYLRAASAVSRLAVGDPDADATSTTYRVPKTASQLERVDGAPFGTRGGLAVVHNFPADGEYVFKLEMHPGPTGFLYGLTTPDERLEISVDGERAALLEIDRWMSESDPSGMRIETVPIHVRAGPHRIAAGFIQQAEGPVDDLLTPIDHTLADAMIGAAYGVTTMPHLRDMAVVGPYRVTGISDTPSRRNIFTCRPLGPDEATPCAESIISRLATRAYRRPLNNGDLNSLMTFYTEGFEDGGFEIGVRTAIQAILASPHFIFRLEEAPRGLGEGETYRISDLALASRLSFFLWGTPPDDELIGIAAAGRLGEPGILDTQVKRMIADQRSEALANRFAAQWLRLQDLEKLHPDAQLFPYYDQRLAAAMARETELLFDHLVRDDRSVLELLTADYTFINERLAAHYGIAGVTGDEYRKVTYPDDFRRGLLGHGSVLALTSHADRTSPVLRGKWVMEVLLGTPPPPPPANVPDLEATEGVSEGRLLTTRERMEQHRSNPVCRSCHQFMDPIGLALDNFDVTGKWRIKENGMLLDTQGELYDGTPITSPADLRQALLTRPEALVRNFTANLLAYALGRRVEYYDMPTVRAIARDAAANDYRMSSFIHGVIESAPFTMARVERADVAADEM